MKITMEVDCTPEEARAFLGLGDVEPLQRALLKKVEERLTASLEAMDPESLMKAWMPLGLQGLEKFQSMFQPPATGGAAGAKPTGTKPTSTKSTSTK
jgi:hypothetical protein